MHSLNRNVTRIVCLVLAGLCLAAASPKAGAPLRLERYDGGFFTIEKPAGWEVITAGQCAGFAFLIRDPARPVRQIFFFGQVGPVYLLAEQRQIDYQYTQAGGYPVTWLDMPVVSPLTPANFLQQFHAIASSQVAQQFMPQAPRLEQLQVIQASPAPSSIPGGTAELVRALFTERGALGEGLFMATVAPVMPYTGGPGGGFGYGFMVVGASAGHDEFRSLRPALLRALDSFTISRQYASACMQQQQQTYSGILKAGRTLSEASDIITEGWENRNRTHDILSEKWSDAILERERLYDPDTGRVYEFESGFYDRYDLQRERYEMSNLQVLPENAYELWMQHRLDGHQHLR